MRLKNFSMTRIKGFQEHDFQKTKWIEFTEVQEETEFEKTFIAILFDLCESACA